MGLVLGLVVGLIVGLVVGLDVGLVVRLIVGLVVGLVGVAVVLEKAILLIHVSASLLSIRTKMEGKRSPLHSWAAP